MSIDLNADVGESFGAWRLGEDAELIPLVSSINVACGFHAGDPLVIERTIALAVAGGAGVGAHPGYPDLPGFGRRDLDMAPAELEAAILYQVGAVAAFAAAAGAELRHVKPHGALYHRASRDEAIAGAVVRGVARFSHGLIVVGLPGSVLIGAARAAGLATAGEGFADRAYEADGALRSRRHADALIADPGRAGDQAVAIARDGRATAIDGASIDVRADTICVHGDEPGAAGRGRDVRAALEAAGVAIVALGR